MAENPPKAENFKPSRALCEMVVDSMMAPGSLGRSFVALLVGQCFYFTRLQYLVWIFFQNTVNFLIQLRLFSVNKNFDAQRAVAKTQSSAFHAGY